MTQDQVSSAGGMKKPANSQKDQNSSNGLAKLLTDWPTVRRLGRLTVSSSSLLRLKREMSQAKKISWQSLKLKSAPIVSPTGLRIFKVWSEEIGQYQSTPIGRKAREYRAYLESPNRVVPGFRGWLRNSCRNPGFGLQITLREYPCGAYEIEVENGQHEPNDKSSRK